MKHLKKRFERHTTIFMQPGQREAWMNRLRQELRGFDWHCRNESEAGVMHPGLHRAWLENGPCKGCPCEPWCQNACRLRLKWWDDSMARLRRRLGV